MELEELDFQLSFELDFQLPLSFDEDDDDDEDDLFHPSSFEPECQLFLVDEDAHVSLLEELLPQLGLPHISKMYPLLSASLLELFPHPHSSQLGESLPHESLLSVLQLSY